MQARSQVGEGALRVTARQTIRLLGISGHPLGLSWDLQICYFCCYGESILLFIGVIGVVCVANVTASVY